MIDMMLKELFNVTVNGKKDSFDIKKDDKIIIYAICGPAGAGKNYVFQLLKETYSDSCNFLIPHTTRPKRETEVDGVDYFFVNEEDSPHPMDCLCYAKYNNWIYYFLFQDLDGHKTNIGIFNIKFIKELKKICPDSINIIPVLVIASEKERLIRQLSREDSPDCDEIIRRYLADKEEYDNFPFDEYITIMN